MRDRSGPHQETSQRSTPADSPGPGKRTLVEQLAVQRKAREPGLGPTTHDLAAQGVAGPGGALPHLDEIQRAFGRHDVTGVQAHTDGAAAAASQALGAEAYATGNAVAFASTSPSLHTAAHEAAHVVQQRGGVQRKGGVGEAGDAHEQHADQVADAVVAGRSAEDLLDRVAGRGGSAPAVQRKPAADELAWKNAVIDGENRIQDAIRAAQRDKRARIELELVIEPDFVGVERHAATGTAPAGKDPDGVGVHTAARAALRDLTADPPRSRRTMTVVLERTATSWERSRYALSGETQPVTDARPTPAASAQLDIANVLQLAQAARHGDVTLDVACSSEGVRILSWRSSGTWTPDGDAAQPSTERSTLAFSELASLAGGRTLVYELHHKIGAGGWQPVGMKLLGEVKPPEGDGTESDDDREAFDPNDAEEIVADVKHKRRLVLSTAAELIAEQDPSRLNNLVFSLGPLMLVGMVRVGKVARLWKRWHARDIKDAVCEMGCENVARLIQKHIGGEIVRIKPKYDNVLGTFRNKNWGWTHHEVVVRNGRVYDLTTGHQGLEIAEYKQLWRHRDDIDFGF